MRKIALLFLILFWHTGQAQLQWMSLEEALAAQQKNPKKILIDFYTDWCTPCHTMDKKTFNHPAIAKLLAQDFYLVKFNAESPKTVHIYNREFGNPDYSATRKRNAMHNFTKFMNVNAVPALVFLDEKSQPITMLRGAFSAKELEPYLPFFASDQYLKITTREDWENYQKKFKSKIKN